MQRFSFPRSGLQRPFEPCSAISSVSRFYVADWCGKRAPDGYEAFRTALVEYRAAAYDYQLIQSDVMTNLRDTCRPDQGKWANPAEVDLVLVPLRMSGTTAIDRANRAWNALKASQKPVFAGDAEAPVLAVAADIEALRGVIERYGQGRLLLESTGELWAGCTSEGSWEVASDALAGDTIRFVDTNMQSIDIAGRIQMAFQATQDRCKAVRVREEIPALQMKNSSTKRSGGAALTYPKNLDVAKKPVTLRVNVTSATSGYGRITVTRGSKGIVATGGWMEPGTFGLLMTVPGKIKTGKVTLKFTADGGPTIKGKIRLG